MQGSNHKGPFTWQLHEDDLEDRLSTDMAAACAAIKHTAVLTIHGDADADVPIKDAYKIAETIKVSILARMEICLTIDTAAAVTVLGLQWSDSSLDWHVTIYCSIKADQCTIDSHNRCKFEFGFLHLMN